ncbi:hypothetical protein M3Y94_00297600 [Aphelenchoides besseyi]|nr:hypothetical protein M3Y94_00297600 [Aphelenchoides besseyi]
MLSCFVAVESALLLTSNDATSNPALVMLAYFVSWLLILLGLVGIKYSCISTAFSTQSITIGHSDSSPIWISTNIPQIGGPDLPGTVNSHELFSGPLPPRYSSLSCAVTADNRRLSLNLPASNNTVNPNDSRHKPQSTSMNIPPPAY